MPRSLRYFSLIGLITCSVVLASPALGARVNGKADSRINRLYARFIAPDDNQSETGVQGAVKRITKLKNGRLREDRLKINLVVPVPGEFPAFKGIDEALAADVQISFSRNKKPYAECLLDASEIHREANIEVGARETAEVSYHIELVKRARGPKTRLIAKHGACDINLEMEGVQTGIPNLERGDRASFTLETESGAEPFLVGEL